MSKRTKLKFKKMLKKAEFVHADLEYHEELVSEARAGFNDAFLERITRLDKLQKRAWERHLKKLNNEKAKQLLEQAEKEQKERLEPVQAEVPANVAEQNKEVFMDGETGRRVLYEP